VYITTGFFQPAVLAVRVDGKGDVTDSHIAWSMTRGAPFTPSPIVVGDELYVVSDLGVLSCVDAKTGKLHWQQRIGGNHSASPIFAGGRIYFLSEEGVTTVIAPGKTFQALAVNEIGGATLASMAAGDGAIFIRSLTHLYRIAGSE
jgi:outer membrane protein assembly factor BamB